MNTRACAICAAVYDIALWPTRHGKPTGNKCRACHNAASKQSRSLPSRRGVYNKKSRESKKARYATDTGYRTAEQAKARNFAKVNRGYIQHRNNLRKLAKARRTPRWLSSAHIDKIKFYYTLAGKLSNLHATKYHVDHIVPLQGKLVCGMHVPWNLQVIPASENLSKHNFFESEEA